MRKYNQEGIAFDKMASVEGGYLVYSNKVDVSCAQGYVFKEKNLWRYRMTHHEAKFMMYLLGLSDIHCTSYYDESPELFFPTRDAAASNLHDAYLKRYKDWGKDWPLFIQVPNYRVQELRQQGRTQDVQINHIVPSDGSKDFYALEGVRYPHERIAIGFPEYLEAFSRSCDFALHVGTFVVSVVPAYADELWWANGGRELWINLLEDPCLDSAVIPKAEFYAWMKKAEMIPGWWCGTSRAYHPIEYKAELAY